MPEEIYQDLLYEYYIKKSLTLRELIETIEKYTIENMKRRIYESEVN